MLEEVLFFEGCPNYGPAVDRVREFLVAALRPRGSGGAGPGRS